MLSLVSKIINYALEFVGTKMTLFNQELFNIFFYF